MTSIMRASCGDSPTSRSITAANVPAVAPSQATISLWSSSGKAWLKACILAFSFSCVFHRYATAASGPAP